MSQEEKGDSKVLKPKSNVGVRHLQALMLCIAMALAYGMRVNLSVAIVAMTDQSKDQYFDWSIQTQSVLLSSFFWGYIVLQIPSGELANRFGGKILIIIAISINSVVSLIIPAGSYYGGWYLVCACRVVQGLAQGMLFPSTHSLLGKWAPIEEKSFLGTFVYIGCQIGMAIQYMISGYIAEYWGWPAIFYVDGSVGALWVALYVFVGANSPHTSSMISSEERLYIEESLGHCGETKKLKTPWKSIWSCVPFLALIVAHCGQNWGFFTLVTEIPSYMAKTMGVNIKHNGVLSALPYLAMVFISFPIGYIADYILKKKWLSITFTRKLFNSIGLYGAALALIGLSYAPAGDVTSAVIYLTLVVGINAGYFAGFILVHIDMAPNFAGTLMGITNFFANIISIIAPLAAGAMLKDETDPQEWRKVFFVSAAIYIAANTVFVLFSSSERQKWNDVLENDTEPDKITKKEGYNL